MLTGAKRIDIIEAADGLLAVFTALGAKGPSVSRLASLGAVVLLAARPNLPTIATDEELPRV